MVLLQTPNSRLLFQAEAFNDPAVQHRFAQRFDQLGIQSTRIEFLTSMPRDCGYEECLQNWGNANSPITT